MSWEPHLQLLSIHPSPAVILQKILGHKGEAFREAVSTSTEVLVSNTQGTRDNSVEDPEPRR